MPSSPWSPHPGKEKANGPTARRPPSGPPRPRRPAGWTPRLRSARGRCSHHYLHSQRLAQRARSLRGGPQMPGWLWWGAAAPSTPHSILSRRKRPSGSLLLSPVLPGTLSDCPPSRPLSYGKRRGPTSAAASAARPSIRSSAARRRGGLNAAVWLI